MNVELLAVNKISDLIASCPHLEPYIDLNDRTPLTDGHIHIHSSTERHTNENFVGRVDVQVKGRTTSKTPTNFRIKRKDLEGYLNLSGVLYFVVSINKASRKRTALYALLNPFKLNGILRGMKPGQKDVAVPLKKLSREPATIENLVNLAHKTQGQSLKTGWDPRLTECIEEFTLHTDRPWDMDSPLHLTNSDMDYSLVVKTGGGMTMPVDWEVRILPASYVGEQMEWEVRSGEHSFQNPVRRLLSKNSFELELSAGLKFRYTFSQDSRTGSISLSLQHSLGGRHRDIGFLLNCMDQGSYTINGQKVDHAVNDLEGEADLRAHYRYLDRLHKLLSKLRFNPDLLSVSDISDRRSDQLKGLYDVLIEGKELHQDIKEAGRIRQPVGSWNIELICLRGREEGKWRCLDLFDPSIGQQFAMSIESEPGRYESFLVTPYETLDEDEIPYTVNLNLPGIVDAYAALPATPKTHSLANHMVLRLIKASDVLDVRKGEFLKAAAALNEWLIAQEPDQPHHQINKWQIAARTRGLSAEERRDIRDLKRDASRSTTTEAAQVEAACAILLGDAEEVEFSLEQLDDPQRQVMRTWPIWSLWTSEAPDPPTSTAAELDGPPISNG